jgi:hypothetical protein
LCFLVLTIFYCLKKDEDISLETPNLNIQLILIGGKFFFQVLILAANLSSILGLNHYIYNGMVKENWSMYYNIIGYIACFGYFVINFLNCYILSIKTAKLVIIFSEIVISTILAIAMFVYSIYCFGLFNVLNFNTINIDYFDLLQYYLVFFSIFSFLSIYLTFFKLFFIKSPESIEEKKDFEKLENLDSE